MNFLIKNVNLVLKDCVKKKDILLKNGLIAEIEENLIPKDDVFLIEGEKFFCMPGLVDLHVHLREPGFTEKETIKTGAKAAAAGGITCLACMANTNPVIDSIEKIKKLKEKLKDEKINILPIAAITKNLKGEELVDFSSLASADIAGFSDDGFFVENSKLMATAVKKAYKLNLPIFSHCEDLNLSKGGILNEGKISEKLNLKGIPNLSESVAVARDVAIAQATNCPIHICHVSTFESVQILKYAKENGFKVTAETAPHYFILTDEEILKKDANFKMNPPLRTKKDLKAIKNALIDGTIDCIATDHAPHEKESKKNLITAKNGVIGLETSLSCTLTAFYETKEMNLPKIAKIMSTNPAKILKLKNKGQILKGFSADIILVDVEKKWTVDEKDFFSKSCNSPFIGKTLTGKVCYTFCNGELIFKL